MCPREFTAAECSNGLDDDGNGFPDCEDFGCQSSEAVTACDATSERNVRTCNDGFDDDGDGAVDCDDSGCARFCT